MEVSYLGKWPKGFGCFDISKYPTLDEAVKNEHKAITWFCNFDCYSYTEVEDAYAFARDALAVVGKLDTVLFCIKLDDGTIHEFTSDDWDEN